MSDQTNDIMYDCIEVPKYWKWGDAIGKEKGNGKGNGKGKTADRAMHFATGNYRAIVSAE